MVEPSDDIIVAHQHSIRHHDEILGSELCGCFYCLRLFASAEIKKWIDDGQTHAGKTALCPHCGIDSVIGSASGFPITVSFLTRMNAHWF